MKNKGFTLIELLLVVAIISLITSVSFFSITEAKKKGEDSHMKAEASQIQTAIELYKQDNNGKVPSSGVTGQMVREVTPEYSNAMQKLVGDGYLSEIPTSPSGSSYAYLANDNETQAVFAAKLNFKEKENNRNKCGIIDEVALLPQVEDGYYAARRTNSGDAPPPPVVVSNCPVVPVSCSEIDSTVTDVIYAISQYESANGESPHYSGIDSAGVYYESESLFSSSLQPLVDQGYLDSIPSSPTGEGYYYYVCRNSDTGEVSNGNFSVLNGSQYCTGLIDDDYSDQDGGDQGEDNDDQGAVCDGSSKSDFCVCI